MSLEWSLEGVTIPYVLMSGMPGWWNDMYIYIYTHIFECLHNPYVIHMKLLNPSFWMLRMGIASQKMCVIWMKSICSLRHKRHASLALKWSRVYLYRVGLLFSVATIRFPKQALTWSPSNKNHPRGGVIQLVGFIWCGCHFPLHTTHKWKKYEQMMG